MTNVDRLRQQYDYNYWAHRRVWRCVEALSDDDFTRDLSYSLGSIRNQVVHTMSAEWLWFSRLRGQSPSELHSPEDFPTRDAVRAEWDRVELFVRDYLRELTDDALDTPVTYLTTTGKAWTMPVWQIVAHVINHSTDHRAQTLAMLHHLGAPTVEQDIIFYFREQLARSTETV